MTRNTSTKPGKVQNKPSPEEQKLCCSTEATSQPCPISKEKEELIQKKAYELYEKRGCQPGCDQEDWYQAEKEVCK